MNLFPYFTHNRDALCVSKIIKNEVILAATDHRKPSTVSSRAHTLLIYTAITHI